MIMISSKAGQRLARAKKEMDRWNGLRVSDFRENFEQYGKALHAYCEAANVVADELIAGRHHESEGD